MRNPFHRAESGVVALCEPSLDRVGRRVPVVYVGPGVPECGRTLDAFRAAGAEVEIVDVSGDEDAQRGLKVCGFERLPVVNTGSDLWVGHQPARIRSFAEAVSEGAVS